jgi:Flp pilus assembly protein TadD
MIEIDDLADHLEYEKEERALASAAATNSIRDNHLAKAERYARRAAQVAIEEAALSNGEVPGRKEWD